MDYCLHLHFVIFSTFRLIRPLNFYRCFFLLNLGVYTELRTKLFIKSTGVYCSNSIKHLTFCLGFQVRQETPEEGRKIHRPKHFEYNYKDEYNNSNIQNQIKIHLLHKKKKRKKLDKKQTGLILNLDFNQPFRNQINRKKFLEPLFGIIRSQSFNSKIIMRKIIIFCNL